jgi:putative hydrolase of the HAD superfamily
MYKAVLWDFGGVITSSPFEAFNRFEQENNLPLDYIRGINTVNPETNAWAQLESNSVSVEDFDELFAAESRGHGHLVRGQQVLALLSGSLRPEMVNALALINKVYRTACITNNVKRDDLPEKDENGPFQQVMSMFDVVIESSIVGIRKPNPKIYQVACEQLDVTPAEAVFLDDLGINLKPARALGMKTIKVLNAAQALDELEASLGMELR